MFSCIARQLVVATSLNIFCYESIIDFIERHLIEGLDKRAIKLCMEAPKLEHKLGFNSCPDMLLIFSGYF